MSQKVLSAKKPTIIYKLECLNSQHIICKEVQKTNVSDNNDFANIPVYVQRKIEKVIREKYLNHKHYKNPIITFEKVCAQETNCNQRRDGSDSSVSIANQTQPKITRYLRSYRSRGGGSDNHSSISSVNTYPTALRCTCRKNSSHTSRFDKCDDYETEYSRQYDKMYPSRQNQTTGECEQRDFNFNTSNLYAFQRRNDVVQTDCVSIKDFTQNAHCSKDTYFMAPATCDACCETNFPRVSKGVQTNPDDINCGIEKGEEEAIVNVGDPVRRPSYSMRFSFELDDAGAARLSTIGRDDRQQSPISNIETSNTRKSIKNRSFQGNEQKFDSFAQQEAKDEKQASKNYFEENNEQIRLSKENANELKRFSSPKLIKNNSNKSPEKRISITEQKQEKSNMAVTTSRNSENLKRNSDLKSSGLKDKNEYRVGEGSINHKFKKNSHSMRSFNPENDCIPQDVNEQNKHYLDILNKSESELQCKIDDTTNQIQEYSSVDDTYFIRLKRKGCEYEKLLENEDSCDIFEIRIPSTKSNDAKCKKCCHEYCSSKFRISGGNQTNSDKSTINVFHMSHDQLQYLTSSESASSDESSVEDLLESYSKHLQTKKQSIFKIQNRFAKRKQAYLYGINDREKYTSTDSCS